MPVQLLRHFWLLALVVMLVNLALWRARLASAGHVARDEAREFIRGAAIAFAVLALAAEVIVIMAGWPNPFCMYTDPPSAPGVLPMWGLGMFSWALLLWWVWRGRGADMLARVGPALMRPRVRPGTYTARQVRIFVTAAVVLTAVGTGIMLSVGPPMPECRELF